MRPLAAMSTLALTVAISLALTSSGAALAQGSPAAASQKLGEGDTLQLTREAILNGVTLAKGSELLVVKVKKDENGAVSRVDLQEPAGQKRVFKAITADAVAALTAAPAQTAIVGDRGDMFKVAAQIPLIRDLTLGGIDLARGAVLQIDKVYKDKAGKVAKVDVRETSGQKRMIRGLTVEQIAFALVPDDVTWPDGAVGRTLTLGDNLNFHGESFAKGSKLTVTRLVTDAKGRVTKVDLHEADGQKRDLAEVSVAVLKQNGALGTAAGAAR